MVDSPYLVRPGGKVRLAKIRTDDTGAFRQKSEAEAETGALLDRLRELQELLYAENRRALLVVFQGMDTSGKDGAIRNVFSGVNPQGCGVASFKKPSTLELSHDFLWRHHVAAPGRGMIVIFNRSHYESVLVERVHSIVPKLVWSARYEHINRFERLLTDEGTRVIKFFLHISKAEQRERLEARLEDPKKNWKFDPNDLAERKHWSAYQRAYEDALEKCSTEHAPWYVVPADRKWFRNWVIADVIVRTLAEMKPKHPPAVKGVEKIRVR